MLPCCRCCWWHSCCCAAGAATDADAQVLVVPTLLLMLVISSDGSNSDDRDGEGCAVYSCTSNYFEHERSVVMSRSCHVLQKVEPEHDFPQAPRRSGPSPQRLKRRRLHGHLPRFGKRNSDPPKTSNSSHLVPSSATVGLQRSCFAQSSAQQLRGLGPYGLANETASRLQGGSLERCPS